MAYLFVVFLGNRDNCCISLYGLSCEQIIVAYLFVVFLVYRGITVADLIVVFLVDRDNCCLYACCLPCE